MKLLLKQKFFIYALVILLLLFLTEKQFNLFFGFTNLSSYVIKNSDFNEGKINATKYVIYECIDDHGWLCGGWVNRMN